jgi:hypothetical protein
MMQVNSVKYWVNAGKGCIRKHLFRNEWFQFLGQIIKELRNLGIQGLKDKINK